MQRTSFFLSLFAVRGFELRAYTLSHSTSPFDCDGFFSRLGLANYLTKAGFELLSS
jgi:hypothetical protein